MASNGQKAGAAAGNFLGFLSNPIVPYVFLAGGILVAAYLLIGKLSDIFGVGGALGAGAEDPGGGAAATDALEAIDNQLEIGKSSLSQSDATQEVLKDPWGSVKSIFGYGSSASGTVN